MNYAKTIYWLPRALSVAFALFIGVFALDVFEEYAGWEAALALLVHLLPSLVLLAVAIAAWKYELVGAVVYAGFAVFYVLMVGLDRHWSWYAGIAGPAALVGILFFLGWLRKKRG